MADEFVQTIHECEEHEDCTVIRGHWNGERVWDSHAHSAIGAEARLNLDYPEAEDWRGPKEQKVAWRLPTDEELDHPAAQEMGWDHEQRNKIAVEAARRNLAPPEELAEQAGMKPAELKKAADAD